MQVETLIEKSCTSIGEGPHWDERTQQLLYVDINEGCFHRWTAATGVDEVYKFDKYCTLVVPCRKGGYLVSVGQSICHFDWDTKKLTTLGTVDEGKDTRINDGKCDPSGRLWFAKVEKHMGSLFSLETDGTIRKHKEGVSISNGLAWTEDNRTMYYIDSIPRKVFAYDFDIATGTMRKELSRVPIPAARCTSCCFGGKNFDELFITCSAFGVTDEEKEKTPLAGSVFRATGLGARGKPAPVYEG
ncbi:RGN-like protein [Mya arenaria]|uniref:RGN-like protein n=1 Tax=Mya arenaria TaxID=6604 RepID=A0ABY7FP16_MYAAR|nr:RGN-like protein [Mya arenaria]